MIGALWNKEHGYVIEWPGARTTSGKDQRVREEKQWVWDLNVEDTGKGWPVDKYLTGNT